MSITPASVVLTALGDTVRLTAEVRDQHGEVMSGTTVGWTSSDASVVTVDGSGLVAAAGDGAATITATAGQATGSAAATVERVVSTVTVLPAAYTLARGDTLRFVASAEDANGNPIDGAAFAWISGDESVATVDPEGLVRALRPGTAAITAAVDTVSGSANITVESSTDRPALAALYEATGGTNWTNRANWLTDAPVEAWHGVGADSAGRVTALDLGGNGLSGQLPEELGQLPALTELKIGDNDLSGPLPQSLTTLRLRTLHYADTELCTPPSGAFEEWLGTISSHDGTGLECEPPTDREILVALYEATGGPYWTENNRWLTDTPLRQWHGVQTGSDGRVIGLWLGSNGLRGSLPSELGHLSQLTHLRLQNNDLRGPIPPEIGDLPRLIDLRLSQNGLTGPVPPELGNLSSLSIMYIDQNPLTGSIPPQLGNLPQITILGLNDTGLSGPVPPELGELSTLTELALNNNPGLTGPIPRSFLKLGRLQWFVITRTSSTDGLCVPGTSEFTTWVNGIQRTFLDYCNWTDVVLLRELYEETGGGNWTDSNGWPGDRAVGEWHGVSADSLGLITGLDLSGNGLVGELPGQLGQLTRMTRLRIGDNALSGRVPLSLASLGLQEFHYADTGLCTPPDAAFRAWLAGIRSHAGTGVECAPLTEREALVAFYEATGGRDWHGSDNWLSDAPIGDWHGVFIDDRGQVTSLVLPGNGLKGAIPSEIGSLSGLTQLLLSGNDLSGPIPPEIGKLSQLQTLWLDANRLTGAIPAEIGKLTRLEQLLLSANRLSGTLPAALGNLTGLNTLWLQRNKLTGPIPPELANLVQLDLLELWENELTGRIPAELGKLPRLTHLQLFDNQLTGPIPSALGELSDLKQLAVYNNGLTGPVPAALARLTRLEELLFANNDLEGPVPPELGGIASLRLLDLSNNSAMSGTLPDNLTALRRLEVLLAGGTGLCAPGDAAFLDWLRSVSKRRVSPCDRAEGSTAYLTQTVQSRAFPVPLVAGEAALLRVFVTAPNAADVGIPPVRATFYTEGTQTLVVDIPGQSSTIPAIVDEGSLSKSANAEIPGRILQPGMEMVIEIDPDGTLDPGLGVAERIPATGRTALDVRRMPALDLTMIPFLWRAAPDSSILDITGKLTADGELLSALRILLPVEDIDLEIHDPVVTSSNFTRDLFAETAAIRAMEGGTGHYLGSMAGPTTGPSGLAHNPGRVSFAVPFPLVIAHELGHNMSLAHAPCGGADGPDPAFPESDGAIGAWGYDFRDGGSLVPPRYRDVMGYCGPAWIGDYHFTSALEFRYSDEGGADAPAAGPSESLLMWGGRDAGGNPFLEPAFVVDAPPVLPPSGGSYEVTGTTSGGDELFALRFDMAEVADGDGSSVFAFVLPVRPGWDESLAGITLSGPDGSFTLDRETDRPAAIVRDPLTGQVRAILRNPPPEFLAQPEIALAAEPDLEVLISRGIPDAAAWRR